ncbi:RNA recognition motif domain [Trinorchestia longiramus]|nr:RNA recognition motif domain [Trinorchestia longiramus]
MQKKQNGFRRDRCGEDNLFVVSEITERKRKKNKKVYLAFLDIEKAYDRVDRRRLLGVLGQISFSENIVNIVKITMWTAVHLRKIFIGGLDYGSTDEVLKNYFSSYGDVVDAVVMKDHSHNRSRGFGFVTFTSPDHVDAVQRARPHKVDGRLVETKRAMPRMETSSFTPQNPFSDSANNRIFIGGLPQDAKEVDLQQYFENFGRTTGVSIMYDKTSGRHRGFAFIDFNDYDAVDKVLLIRHHAIKGRSIDVKKAISKADIKKLKTMMLGASADAQATLHSFLSAAATLPPRGASAMSHPVTLPHASVPVNPHVATVHPHAATLHPHATIHPHAATLHPHAATIPVRVAAAVPHHPLGNIAMATTLRPQMGCSEAGGGTTRLIQPMSGWQYSVSSTAEVLRNTASAEVPRSVSNAEVPRGVSNAEVPRSVSSTEVPRSTASTEVPRSTASTEVPHSAENAEVPRRDEIAHGSAISRDGPSNSSSDDQSMHIKEESQPSASTAEGLPIKMEDMSDEDLGGVGCGSSGSICNGTAEGGVREAHVFSTSERQESTNNSLELDTCPPNAHLLFIEPFCGGSHKQLLQTILSAPGLLPPDSAAVFTLPAKKWHWRARTSALNFSQSVPTAHLFRVLFCSATLNLCELVGLRPDLAPLRKIIYFHENQLVYPVRDSKERDFQYGYNQILSALVADRIVFNSQYNLESFMREVPRHLNLQQDRRPDTASIAATIRAKSQVLYFPVEIKQLPRPCKDALEPLHIIWPHRWEHDKDPETFFLVLFQLAESGLNFRVSVLGESFSQAPPIFEEALQRLRNFIVHWGYAQTREKYWQILHSGDVVVSTAHHEFLGVAMLEAVGAGCLPLCPNRLVYPEVYPKECLYNTQQQLFKALAGLCRSPQHLRNVHKPSVDLQLFSWSSLRPQYADLLGLAE